MNSHIDRLRTAANAAARDPLRQPDLFERSVWLVDEISAASGAVAAQLVNLRVARIRRDIDALDRANAEIAKLFGQASTLINVLAEQIAKHKAGSEP